MSASRRESASAKKVGGSSSWKARLRAECFDRLRQERERILWAARGDQQAVQGALHQLVSNVVGDLQQGQQGQPATPSQTSGQHGAPLITPGPVTPGAAGVAAGPSQDIFQLEGDEYGELMRALEVSLLEDKLQEEAAYLEGLEQQEVEQAVDAYYAHSLEHQQHQGQGQGEQPGVLCPLCHQAYLVQHKGVIFCPRQDLRLDVAIENLTLEDLRQRLAAVLQAHSLRGCNAQPAFGLQQHGGGLGAGVSMLCIACRHCGCFEVVL